MTYAKHDVGLGDSLVCLSLVAIGLDGQNEALSAAASHLNQHVN